MKQRIKKEETLWYIKEKRITRSIGYSIRNNDFINKDTLQACSNEQPPSL
jgi:hypothetical protein